MVVTTKIVGLGPTETWKMEMTITVITLQDILGLRSYTPLLDLWLAMVNKVKETKLTRDS